MIYIKKEEVEEENHLILKADVSHTPIPVSAPVDGLGVCKICGLHYHEKAHKHISRWAGDIAKKRRIPLLRADYEIVSGLYSEPITLQCASIRREVVRVILLPGRLMQIIEILQWILLHAIFFPLYCLFCSMYLQHQISISIFENPFVDPSFCRLKRLVR